MHACMNGGGMVKWSYAEIKRQLFAPSNPANWPSFSNQTTRAASSLPMAAYLMRTLEKNPLLIALLFWEGARMTDKTTDFPEEDEPGYFLPLVTTLMFKINQMPLVEPLTPAFIEKLHGECTKNVRNINPGNHAQFTDHASFSQKENTFSTSLREQDLPSHFAHQAFIIDCVRQLQNSESGMRFHNQDMVLINLSGKRYDGESISNFSYSEEGGLKHRGNAFRWHTNQASVVEYHNQESRDVNTAVVDIILRNYAEAMAVATDEQAKMVAIVTMIQRLERLHAFSDANCRTLCMTLLNLELIKHGLFPTIQTDPNYFDCLPVDALVAEIMAGQERFVRLFMSQDQNAFLDRLSAMIFTDGEQVPHQVSTKWLNALVALGLDDALHLGLSCQRAKVTPTPKMLAKAIQKGQVTLIHYLLSQDVRPSIDMIQKAIDVRVHRSTIMQLIEHAMITDDVVMEVIAHRQASLIRHLLHTTAWRTHETLWLAAIALCEENQLLPVCQDLRFNATKPMFMAAISNKKILVAHALCNPTIATDISLLRACAQMKLDGLRQKLVDEAIQSDQSESVVDLIRFGEIQPNANMLTLAVRKSNVCFVNFLCREYAQLITSKAFDEAIDNEDDKLIVMLLEKSSRHVDYVLQQLILKRKNDCITSVLQEIKPCPSKKTFEKAAESIDLKIQKQFEALQSSQFIHDFTQTLVEKNANDSSVLTDPKHYPCIYAGCEQQHIRIVGNALVILTGKNLPENTQAYVNALLDESRHIGLDAIEFRMNYSLNLECLMLEFVRQLNERGAHIKHFTITTTSASESCFFSESSVAVATELGLHGNHLTSIDVVANDKGAKKFAEVIHTLLQQDGCVLEEASVFAINQWNHNDTASVVDEALNALNRQVHAKLGL